MDDHNSVWGEKNQNSQSDIHVWMGGCVLLMIRNSRNGSAGFFINNIYFSAAFNPNSARVESSHDLCKLSRVDASHGSSCFVSSVVVYAPYEVVLSKSWRTTRIQIILIRLKEALVSGSIWHAPSPL